MSPTTANPVTRRATVLTGLALMTLPIVGAAAEAEARAISPDIEPISAPRAAELDKALAALVVEHGINTAAVGVIQDGRLAWQGYYGEQAPGVPASAETLFDVGSITKTVTAETVLRLVSQGKLSLDEAMSAHWVDPDLADDPRHHQLTPRMALTHTTGFMNWRYFAEGRKLGFVNEPGTTFGYSGEGVEYLARYAEAKLGRSFEQLAQTHVFGPVGMASAAMSVHRGNFPRIARPLDRDGTFHGYYCRPEGWCREEGDTSVAGSMVITVRDYARFLIASQRGEGLSAQLRRERDTLHAEEDGIDCHATPEALCPTRVGYGLGWNITELPGDKTIGHRGSDWAVVSLAYYYAGSGDGLIVFFNAPNAVGIAGMVDALELLDPDSAELHGYKARRARAGG